nr:hypothetical protein CFP56_10737 [Quercus suber]
MNRVPLPKPKREPIKNFRSSLASLVPSPFQKLLKSVSPSPPSGLMLYGFLVGREAYQTKCRLQFGTNNV